MKSSKLLFKMATCFNFMKSTKNKELEETTSDSEDQANIDLKEDSVPMSPSNGVHKDKVHTKQCPRYVEAESHAGKSKSSGKKSDDHSCKHFPRGFHIPPIPPNARVNIINAEHIDNLQIGFNNKIYSKDSSKNPNPPSYSKFNNVPITESKRQLTVSDKYLVAENISKNWKELGSRMKMSSDELQTLEYNHRSNGLTEIIIEMINKWEMENPIEANASSLAKLLKETGRPDIACKIPD